VRLTYRPFENGDTDGIHNLILPIQNDESGLPADFSFMKVDTRFYRMTLN